MADRFKEIMFLQLSSMCIKMNAYVFAITFAILFGITDELHQFLCLDVIAVDLMYVLMELAVV